MSIEKIRLKVISIFLSALTIFLFFFITYSLYQRNVHIEEKIEQKINEYNKLYRSNVYNEGQNLQMAIKFILDNKDIERAFLNGNRDKLFNFSKDIFSYLNREFKITHFYFHDKNGVNFLRVHKKEKHGDLIDRHTMKEAKDKETTSKGIELGPLGTYTLRIVVPWIIDGKKIGHIELGKEINHILKDLKSNLSIDTSFLIYKKNLNKDQWEQWNKNENKWDEYQDFIVDFSTNNKLKPLLEKHIKEGHSVSKLGRHLMSLNDTQYTITFIPVIEKSGKKIGEHLLHIDVSNILKSTRNDLVIIISVLSFLISIVLFFLFRKLAQIRNTLISQLEIIQENEKNLKSIIDHVQHGLILIDFHTREIIDINPAGLKIIKLTNKDTIIGTICNACFCSRKSGECPIMDKFKDSQDGQVKATTFDGQKLVLKKSAIVINLGERKVVLESFTDITKIIESEKKISYMNEKLKKSNKELENFAYVASHDLQEPLRVITSYNEILFEDYGDQLSEEGERYKNFIIEATKRMKILISDLLALSRIDTQGRPFKMADIKEIVEMAQFNLKMVIKENNSQIICNDFDEIYCDESQILQVFQNLLSNSMKYRSEQDPKIIIEQEEYQDYWKFKITDNGIGIDPKFKDKIFEIFKRLHRRSEKSGTGIGLSISKKIIERHGGNIWVDSSEGRGSTFNFTIKKRSDNAS